LEGEAVGHAGDVVGHHARGGGFVAPLCGRAGALRVLVRHAPVIGGERAEQQTHGVLRLLRHLPYTRMAVERVAQKALERELRVAHTRAEADQGLRRRAHRLYVARARLGDRGGARGEQVGDELADHAPHGLGPEPRGLDVRILALDGADVRGEERQRGQLLERDQARA
jgi:hypothetical protein